MDVSYSLDELEVIVDTYTLDPRSDPRSPERLYVVRPVPTAAQQLQLYCQYMSQQPLHNQLYHLIYFEKYSHKCKCRNPQSMGSGLR